MNEITEFLEEFAALNNTELGEVCEALILMWRAVGCNCSEEFVKLLEKEIIVMYSWIKENFVLKTETKTYTKEIKRFVYKDKYR